MKDFLKSAHFKIMTAIVVLLFIIMLFVSILGVWSSPQSTVLSAIFTPIQKGATAVSNGTKDFFSAWGERNQLKKDNEALQEEINELRKNLIDYESAKQENEMFRDYLSIKDKDPNIEFEPAKLISRDASDKFYSFSIDKGTNNGISKYDPVITPSGLVGYVSKVAGNYAIVTTILNPDINVSIIDSRTRADAGVLTGSMELAAEGVCAMTLLPQNTTVEVGDFIITTGYGGIFPKEFIVGKVKEVKQSNIDISYTAIIEPAVDVKNVRDVLVIKHFEGQGSVVEEEAPAAAK